MTAAHAGFVPREWVRATSIPSASRRRLALAALALLLACAGASAREAAAAGGGVDIGGEHVKAAHLALADLAKLPHVSVRASAHGVEGDWSGVPLIELLKSAGAPSGETLRGPAMALYVRVTASDGYRAVFALAGIDSSIGGETVILADGRNGQPLDDKEGPLRIIAPGDRRPARWVRQVIAIDLLRAPDSKS
ncbi:MAG TPA: molybdopterin-dependent oxidoreductase [Rhodanobacteraceae bacterium]|nr:molybdopterin-dependent oxidoreductase [Rhodanobacteraceae bacterium]